MVEIKWQNPPSRSSLGTMYDEIVEELKKNPGRWALVSEDWKTSAPPAALRKAGCESTCRANKDAKVKSWRLYARFPDGGATGPQPRPADNGKAAVANAVATGTALTPPPVAPRRPAPATPVEAVQPANDFGMGAFRAARAARGVPPEGKQ